MDSLNLKVTTGISKTRDGAQNVMLYGHTDRTQELRRLECDPIGSLYTKNLTDIENVHGFAQVQLGTASATDTLTSSTIVPVKDANARDGWYFQNSVANTSLALKLFDGAKERVNTVAVDTFYAVMFVDSYVDITSFPRFEVFTKPTGTGDHDLTFHSKFTYSIKPPTVPGTSVMGMGEEVVFWAKTRPLLNLGQRFIELSILTVLGDGASGDILKIELLSDASAPVDSIQMCINQMGWNSAISLDFQSRNVHLTTPDTSTASLAKEATLAAMNGKITKGSDATLVEAQQVGSYAMNESTNVWQPLSAHHSNKNLKTTDANIINGNQISKIMGIDSGGAQQQIKVSNAGRIELDAYNLTSLSTANNQTNGTQVSKIMGSEDGATTGIQHQLKCDANGVLETSGGGGGGGDASAANQTNGNQLSKVMGIYTPTNTQVQLKAFVDGTLYVNNGFSTSHIGKADIDVTIPAGTAEAYLAPYTSMSIYSRAVIYGNTTNWNDKIYVSYGKTGAGTFYKDWENPINVDSSSGDFFRQLSGVCASWRLSKANTSNVEETIKILSAVSQGN